MCTFVTLKLKLGCKYNHTLTVRKVLGQIKRPLITRCKKQGQVESMPPDVQNVVLNNRSVLTSMLVNERVAGNSQIAKFTIFVSMILGRFNMCWSNIGSL